MKKTRVQSSFGFDIYCDRNSKCKYRSICLCAWDEEPTNDDCPLSLIHGNMKTYNCLTLDDAHWDECRKVYLAYLNNKIKSRKQM